MFGAMGFAGSGAHAPDLTIRSVSTAALAGNWQRLQVSGQLGATVANSGDIDAEESSTAVFIDVDRDGRYDAAKDDTIVKVETAALGRLTEVRLHAPISTTVAFRDAPLWVAADAAHNIAEFSELDNVRRTGEDCVGRADPRRPAPDLTASYLRLQEGPSPGTVRLTVRIGNGGAVPAARGVPVEFTSGDHTDGAATSRELAPAEYEDVPVQWADEDLHGLVTARVDAALGSAAGDCNAANDEITAAPELDTAPPIHIYLPRSFHG